MENITIKTNRKISYTKKVLRDSLIEIMKTTPITNISIKDICTLADISRSTFYTYYKNQYDLLQKTQEETFAYFEDILNKYSNRNSNYEIIQKITQMIEELLLYIANNNNFIQILLSENGDVNFQKRLLRRYYKQAERLFHKKTLTDKTREYYSVFEVNGTIGLIQHWLKNNMDVPIHELAVILTKLSVPADL
ncbi:MAG: TetR/AcrR family transcriptional regulator [Spirochaetaceae bacterium]|jgi:AcrR family transcriptional regulator|nr:TetR/AcrR family transcriptional regulator [Spirochaetaceae bacterium]